MTINTSAPEKCGDTPRTFEQVIATLENKTFCGQVEQHTCDPTFALVRPGFIKWNTDLQLFFSNLIFNTPRPI